MVQKPRTGSEADWFRSQGLGVRQTGSEAKDWEFLPSSWPGAGLDVTSCAVTSTASVGSTSTAMVGGG
ncbi:hypothetical protein RRG08_059982 [Elysia crispata]|uniref:Uncharacterized protein n=1 Tax=Elysia crispata TaxID=231223 RepID=A0AAE1AKL2_9GAST|nr:hypothetical protein RRG08_059982 [Elysia crispata]